MVVPVLVSARTAAALVHLQVDSLAALVRLQVDSYAALCY